MLAAAAILGSAAARGQISPGDLAHPHAHLEGSRACLQCHAPGQGVASDRCLDCHVLLAERIAADQGFHSGRASEACGTCHIEHQGRDFELVWWGENGVEAFDHREAGWPLEGRHASLACRSCHRPDHIADPRPLLAAEKDLTRTFLGLGITCASCHDDPHGGQFSDSPCETCHGQSSFAPAAFFDHETVFPLEGAHAGAACTACHPPLVAADAGEVATTLPGALRFRALGRTACADCHDDPHASRLGSACASCHDQESWSSARSAGFDHSLTRFPLRGRHRPVACESCHGPDFTVRRPRGASCGDCHTDPHLGQIADVAQRCDACHDVDGFRPARFTVSDHDLLGYPLEGRHRETACESCHPAVPSGELADALDPTGTLLPDEPDVPTRRFRLAFSRCTDCHDDPHSGTATELEASSCTSCHDLTGWHSIAFSHRRTGWPLEGEHRGIGCGDCHAASALGGPTTSSGAPRFDGLDAACAGCHRDPHAGQFARGPRTAGTVASTPCERCHGGGRFRPAEFDHRLDSRFPLEGAHAHVACDSCHPTVRREDVEVVLYRPLGRECSDCHLTPPPAPPPPGRRR